jgi:hypothetical protein
VHVIQEWSRGRTAGIELVQDPKADGLKKAAHCKGYVCMYACMYVYVCIHIVAVYMHMGGIELVQDPQTEGLKKPAHCKGYVCVYVCMYVCVRMYT